jgi:membrane-associated phospholipid phosphatase
MKKKIHAARSKIISIIKLLSIELGIILVAFLSAFLLVVTVVRRIFLHEEETLDYRVFDYFQQFVSDNMTAFMQFFTYFGSHDFLIPANLILIADTFFIRKDKWFAIKVAAIASSSLLLMFSLKYIFHRPRPLIPLLEEAAGLSFPSGHAFMSFAFFGLLIYMSYSKIKRKWLKVTIICILLFMILIIGISRIYLRVHYFSDVIAGFSLGFMWLVLSFWTVHIIENHRKSKTRL